MTDASAIPSSPPSPPGGPDTLFIFDGYNFIFRAFHAIPMLNAPDGRPTNAVQGFARMVQAARRDFAPQSVVAIFDAGGDGGRKAEYKDYKGQRPPPPEDLIPQFAMVREATDALGIPRVEHPDYEADDLIAAYAIAARKAGKTVTIISGDKDLMQLCTLADADGPPVFLYDTMKDRVFGPAEVFEKFGVLPDLLGDLLALTGDSSDNIPGVQGIGPKTGAALLAEYGTLEGVLAAAPQIKQKKRRERLIEFAEDARMSRRLVELRSHVELPRTLESLVDPGADDAVALAYFEPLGFRQLMREMGGTSRATKAAAAMQEGDPGAFELVATAGFGFDPADARVLMAADKEALDELVATLAVADHVAIHLVTDGVSRAQTEATLGAKLCGIAVAAQGLAATYVPFAHRQADLVEGKQLDEGHVLGALGPWLADPKRSKILHAYKAASHALANHEIELCGVDEDPMLVSYTLDPARSSHELDALAKDVLGHVVTPTEKVTGKGRKYTSLPDLSPANVSVWACERAAVTLALGDALRKQIASATDAVAALIKSVEMPLATVLAKIERRGIQLDNASLRQQGEQLAVEIDAVVAKIVGEAGSAINLDSPLQLQKLLFEDWGLEPTRKIKSGYSTDAAALEKLSDFDPRVKMIMEYRSLSKLKNTYLDALPKLVRPGSGRLHTSFHQAVAATGRLSSQDPNLQNIPIRTAMGRRIRDAFVAPKGHQLVAIDYSQIELRVLAHMSGDPNLMSAFVDDVDVHKRTASEVFDVPESEVTDEQRRIAKAVNFGVVYGQTQFGLAMQLGIPRGKAGSYIRAYFAKIPGVRTYMQQLVEVAKQRGFAETILGRRRRIPELGRKGPARAHGERIARNTPIQGSAADILKLAMIAVERELAQHPWARVLLTVHDELIFECETERVDELIAMCRPLMESALEPEVKLKVPLKVEAGFGPTWGACKG